MAYRKRYKHPCFLEPIHTKTMRYIEQYNEHGTKEDYTENRILLKEYNGIRDGKENWYQDMDTERKQWGHNKKRIGFTAIITPHPDDNATPEQVLEVANKWVQHFFGDGWCTAGVLGCYASVIEIHNDSHERIKAGKKGIVHAHITINCTNRIPHNGRLYKMQIPHQVYKFDTVSYKNQLFKEMGWHYFDDWDENGEMLPFDERENVSRTEQHHKEIKDRSKSQTPPEKHDKTSLRLLEQNKYSWKEDIRARVKIASNMAKDERQFIAILEKSFDIKVSKNSKGNDFVYSLKDEKSKKICGRTLGNNYTPWGIKTQLYYNNKRQYYKLQDSVLKKALGKSDGLVAFYSADKKISLKDIATAYSTINKFEINSISQLEHMISLAGDNKAYKDVYDMLTEASKTISKIDILPQKLPAGSKYEKQAILKDIIFKNLDVSHRFMADVKTQRKMQKQYREKLQKARQINAKIKAQKGVQFNNDQVVQNQKIKTQTREIDKGYTR